MATNLVEIIAHKIASLPVEQQKQVLSIVNSMAAELGQESPLHTGHHKLCGQLTFLNQSLTSDDIAEARREMWGKFDEDQAQ
ncbi:MAG: hypothetical protein HY774_23245 [Acidobacteria bacterium]|nr:hypothetical protein [Acidobacteriota bacterium]